MAFAFLSPITPVSAQRPLNLGFEIASVARADRPWGWALGYSAFLAGSAATFTLDTTRRHEGSQSLRIEIADSVTIADPQQLMVQVPATFARGHTLELRGWLTSARLHGTAMVTMEAWGDRVVIAADTVARNGARAETGDWREFTLTIAVPNDATIHSVVVIVSLEGKGAAWFDGFSLTVDGQPAGALPDVAPAPTDGDLEALLAHAVPLRSVVLAVSSDDRDLALIDGIVAGARIVGLGESTHGTREFFQVKHRLLEYLVRVHGFRVFALEANQLAVERINAYVQGGEGTARDVARSMFAVWNTVEVVELIDWLRSYNLAHRNDPVRFAGYDMQDHRRPADSLRAFMMLREPEWVPRLDSLVAEYRAQASYATPQVDDTTRARWAGQADEVWAHVRGRHGSWLTDAHDRRDTLAVEWAVQSADLFRQAARFNVALSSPERDSLMADNLLWLLGTVTPGAKAVVWAHDVHVSHGGDPVFSFNAGAQMGAHLRRVHGDGYRALTLITYDGMYTATRGLSDFTMMSASAFPGPSGSIEEALHRLRRPAGTLGWLVNLRSARDDSKVNWLNMVRPVRHIGYAAYDYGFDLTASIPFEYDGIVFVDHTSASRPLR